MDYIQSVTNFFMGDGFDQFFITLYHILDRFSDILIQTTNYLDGIDFSETSFAQYMGYFRYLAGDGVYIPFTTVTLIAVGVEIWKTLLKGVGWIKNLLPFG